MPVNEVPVMVSPATWAVDEVRRPVPAAAAAIAQSVIATLETVNDAESEMSRLRVV